MIYSYINTNMVESFNKIEDSFLNEAVTKTKYGYNTGVSVKGKNITVLGGNNGPKKEDIEANIDKIKESAKLLNANWNSILDEAAKKHKKYIDNCYEGRKDNKEYIKMLDKYNTIEKAKKGLKYTGILLNTSKTINEVDSFTAFFDSEVMDKDMHSMFVEIDIMQNGKIKVTYITIEG